MELVIMGVFMCIAFLLGRLSVSKKVEEIKEIKPVKKIKKKNDDFKLDEATITMLENIDNYDGTSQNQKDVPEEV